MSDEERPPEIPPYAPPPPEPAMPQPPQQPGITPQQQGQYPGMSDHPSYPTYRPPLPPGYYPPQQQGYAHRPPYPGGPPPGPPMVAFVGGGQKVCPRCRVGAMIEDYTMCGIVLAIVFFPFGLICCMTMKDRTCSHCRYVDPSSDSSDVCC